MNEASAPRRRGPLIVGVVVVAVLATAGVAIVPAFVQGAARRERRLALTPDKEVESLRLPPFALTTQDGAPFTGDDFIGRVSIVDFVFTSCTFVCPTLTQKMLQLQHALADTDVRLVSVSVDPQRDTPERLREHAARVGADTRRWTFLSGPWDEVVRLSEEGLRLGLAPDSNPENVIHLDDGTTMQNIAHTARFTLIGPDGAVLGLYNGLDAADIERLATRARIASETR